MAYQQFPVIGPFAGHVDNVPSPHNPSNSFDEIVNFLCRKGRFHSRPKLVNFGAPPDGAIVRLFRTYLDVQSNWHTLALTTKNAYALTAGPTYNVLAYPAGVTDLSGTSLPYGNITLNSRVYFSNNSAPILYIDGSSQLKSANAPGSAAFMAVNSQQLILANTIEPASGTIGSITFPQRVRWSKAGDPNTWNSFDSGANDLLDVPDVITGIATLGQNTLVFRTNGITIMSPTGNVASPFTFQNMASAPSGIGNRFPYALAMYGETAAFVSNSDIYTISSGLQYNPIGGKAKKKIFSQLEQASGDQVCAWIVPRLGPGVDYLSYWLSIPGVNVTWVYNYDEQSWQEFTSLAGRMTFLGGASVA